MSGIRRQVMTIVGDVLREYGMRPAHRVEIEERGGGVRVRIACAQRVPQYVGDRIKTTVAHQLALDRDPSATILVAVVADRTLRAAGRPGGEQH
ncbi:hypothetical protein Athai_15310 [Actinocatenispora thailandica]|uniref:Uncharacterized protein n=1 Tax=Actinocatenispora thailandica TaxID=227318 RepID=A0A7R7HWD7_9ACTN|nr:hypothetical protein [Actinocatenispora thailandica]BCJ34028.1 hypothetical protein Athai_15310 [Actinocatenispora thailandica]